MESGLTTTYEIPRIIWCYWSSDTLAEGPQLVTDRWKQMLGPKGFEIRIVTPGNTSQYVSETDIPRTKLDNMIVQHRSDWIRLYLLKKYGGIWSDIVNIYNDVAAFENLYQQTMNHHADIGGFYVDKFQTNPKYCVVETWMYLSPKGSPFFARLFEEFDKAINMGLYQYKLSLQEKGVDFQKIFEDEKDVYLVQHACIQYILQSRPNYYNLYLLKAEDSMYRLHCLCEWNLRCINKRKSDKDVLALPFVKIRGCERSSGKPFYVEAT
jgi:hypothetical protein